MHAVEIDELTKAMSGRTIIDRISLVIAQHSVFGLLGPNGAGKTTLLRLMLGLLHADRGTVRLFGHDIGRNRRAALRGVGSFIEAPALYGNLSGRVNLQLHAKMMRLPDATVDEALDIAGMQGASAQLVRTYSLGMRQRLGLAKALLGKPRLLILDEPTNGLDPDGIAEIRTLIADLPQRIGGTVILSSHLLSEVEHVADQVAIVRHGRIVADGNLATLLSGNRDLVIETTDVPGAALLLGHHGFQAEMIDERLIVAGGDLAGCTERRARINRLLVEADFGVSAIFARPKSLEDLYQGVALRTEDVAGAVM